MVKARVAVIGGSGLEELEGFRVRERAKVQTPYGEPSADLIIGDYADVPIAFLPRHGPRHHLIPTAVNYRANVWALKSVGVEQIVSVSAVGSLKLEIEPRMFVIPDQFYDNTKRRVMTFFDEGPVVHVAMADPYCPRLAAMAAEACARRGVTVRRGGTYVCIEGPQFSTRAESRAYRQLGFDVIGMTSATEAKLAREAEMCYITVALVTDYDVWHEADVTIEMVLENMRANVANVKAVLEELLPHLGEEDCPCRHALAGAIITDWALVPQEVKERLRPIVGKYWEKA